MRHPSDVCAEQFVDRKCNTCGKMFVPAIYHQHITYERLRGKHYIKKYYCSYKCLNEHRDAKKKTPIVGKAIVMSDANGNIIATFPNAHEAAMSLAAKGTNFDDRKIREACKQGKLYHGFLFAYKEKDNEQRD